MAIGDNLAKAREAKRLKREEAAQLTQASVVKEASPIGQLSNPCKFDENARWRVAFFVAMRNKEVKTSGDLGSCVALADSVVALFAKEGRN